MTETKPMSGGSYVRQEDGALKLVERTETAETTRKPDRTGTTPTTGKPKDK